MIPPEDQHEPSGAVEIDYKFLAENCVDILNRDLSEMIDKDFDVFVFHEDVAVLDDAAASSVDGGAADSQATVRLIK